MPKGRNHLNTIYISERLQECLRPISQCALTTVTAQTVEGRTGGAGTHQHLFG